MIRSILSLLEGSVEAYSRKTALSDEHTNLTYCELSDLSMRIGSILAQKTSLRRPIPALTEKSIFTLGAFIGVIRADCFYVCLDANQPAERLNRIPDTFKADFMIADKKSLDLTVDISLSGEMLSPEDLKSLPGDALNSNLLASIRRQTADTDPLYGIFTSGSTGVPEGVVVSHHSVIGFIQHSTDLFHITQGDVIDDRTPFDFDVSVKDIHSTLKIGATIEIIPKKLFSIPTGLLDYLCDRKITTATWAISALCVITTLKGFTYRIPSHLNRVLFGEEVMPVRYLNIWHSYLPDTLFINPYNPTGITCNYTYYVTDRESEPGTSLPIEISFPNETVFLLDESNRLATEPGQNGGLCMAGIALALGYYRDPKRIVMAFTQNPLNPCHLEIIYRTGDLTCHGRDGLLYFNGRKDFQIKHMGHRIELGEVEAALETVEDVDRAVYLFLGERSKIATFYEGATVKRNAAVGLGHFLPRYMFLILYRNLTELPRIRNDKVDRQVLRKLYE